MKRPLTLIAAILATVLVGIDFLIELIGFFQIISLLSNPSINASGIGGALALMVIMILIIATCLILNICSIPTWNKDAQGYKKKKGLLIATIVFNFIAMFLYIISMLGGLSNAFSLILVIIVMISLLASSTLYIVDLARESSKVEKLAKTTEQVSAQETSPAQKEPAKSNSQPLETKLEKLNEMKKNGLISTEEYESIKKSYIDETLKK